MNKDELREKVNQLIDISTGQLHAQLKHTLNEAVAHYVSTQDEFTLEGFLGLVTSTNTEFAEHFGIKPEVSDQAEVALSMLMFLNTAKNITNRDKSTLH